MPTYLSPGVYVEEVPSAVKPIAGVSTSTAGFIGIVADTITVPLAVSGEKVADKANGNDTTFDLKHHPVYDTTGPFTVRVNGVPAADATLKNDATAHKSQVTFTTAPAANSTITADYVAATPFVSPVPVGEPKLCTNFTEYKKFFGDFSESADGKHRHRNLTHAVYGFFNNGGTRCYVARVTAAGTEVETALRNMEAVDEIAIVAAPGMTDDDVTAGSIITHCQQLTQDRFAIFDSPEAVEGTTGLDLTLLSPSNSANLLPPNSDFAALYFPWIQVFDQPTKTLHPEGNGLVFVPPSGHVAGVYARTDAQRGVHKAPANQAVFGAVGLKYSIGRVQQDGLNPQGVNCIRNINGNITVWGARTTGGDANTDLKYVNVRRTLLFIRESIDEGTQWIVFEPNTSALWAKIVRNVSAFLTNVWRSGALFGDSPDQAFYVKCDAELNPPEVREVGQVVTEVGVAIVRPAEFVIFRISQMAAK